jgi:hypothetical protein
VQSIPLPTVVAGSQRRLIASGTATSEGLLTRSADGLFVLLTGYDAPIPTAGLAGTTGTAVARVVGRVDIAGNVDTTTGLSDLASGNNPRGVASTNGFEGADANPSAAALADSSAAAGAIAASFGVSSIVEANVYAANGTVWLEAGSQAAGAFIGARVRIGVGARIALDSAFK